VQVALTSAFLGSFLRKGRGTFLRAGGADIALYVCDPLYCCALRTYSARNPHHSVFVNARRARWRGDDLGADIKGDVCATRARFMFQLTKQKAQLLTSQIAMSKPGRGGRRTLPYVFTERQASAGFRFSETPRCLTDRLRGWRRAKLWIASR
jgi:hypothetical protein